MGMVGLLPNPLWDVPEQLLSGHLHGYLTSGLCHTQSVAVWPGPAEMGIMHWSCPTPEACHCLLPYLPSIFATCGPPLSATMEGAMLPPRWSPRSPLSPGPLTLNMALDTFQQVCLRRKSISVCLDSRQAVLINPQGGGNSGS